MDATKILGSLLSSGVLSKGSGGNVLGNILGAALGGSQNQQTQGGGMLGDILGSVLSGGSNSSGGGLGNLLGSVLGGGSNSSSGGGLGDLLGSVFGGSSSSNSSSGGGLGNLLGSVLGGGSSNSANVATGNPQVDAKKLEDMLGVGKGGLGSLIGGALAKYGQVASSSHQTPDADDNSMLPSDLDASQVNDQAKLVIKAMVNAAKADGKFDQDEQQKILAKLGDLTDEEKAYIKSEFDAPLDVQAFASSVPRGMEHQIYALSLSAIDLDQNSEAQYLAQLAQALRITPQEANEIHAQLGAPQIFNA